MTMPLHLSGYVSDGRVWRKTVAFGVGTAPNHVASLKSEIAALKGDWEKRWWHDQPNNGDLQKVIVLLDRLAAVTERIEKKMPPNDKDHESPVKMKTNSRQPKRSSKARTSRTAKRKGDSRAAHGSASIRMTAGDWGGNYNAPDGREAIKLFFRDIMAGKIKLCQLSPTGNWLRSGGEEIAFRIAPALMLAGKMTMDEVSATLKAYDLDFSADQITAMAREDAWMLE